MLVSWNWLKDYLALDMPPDELVHRLMMAGLNHESTTAVGNDLAIDLEITSNRPDCLGHVGIAREIAMLWERELRIPAPALAAAPALGDIHQHTSVRLECPEHCRRYSARLLRGVKVGPSPAWLADRLRTIGVAVINNVVDATNYVLMECGQPLHAFDFAKLAGQKLVVRTARTDEAFAAIDHRSYRLDPSMCVIADAEKAVAIGGVMGGAETEVSSATTDVLIEAADFAPLSIRTTARKLSLHSPSSYRFERGVDGERLDWASQRCCELILKMAGGQLVEGAIVVGATPPARTPITLRLSQLRRVLGIDVPPAVVERILRSLGGEQVQAGAASIMVTPPSWRRDLTREIDLVEEVARVHGYEHIPEDAQVPMAPSHRSSRERILSQVRSVFTAAGFNEAVTVSLVTDDWSNAFSPWTSEPPLATEMAILRGANRLRRSLVPSLLDVRRTNEALANPHAELFETAAVYLPRPGELPNEQWTAALVTGRGFAWLKGTLETLCRSLHISQPLTVEPLKEPLLHPDRSGRLRLGDEVFGVIGEVTPVGLKQFGLRSPTVVAEIRLAALANVNLIPQFAELSSQPAISRDLNLIVDESVRWSDLATTVRQEAGPLLESLNYQETYRNAEKDGAGKKRLLFSFMLRAADRTLTGEEADAIRDRIVGACMARHGATLLAS